MLITDPVDINMYNSGMRQETSLLSQRGKGTGERAIPSKLDAAKKVLILTIIKDTYSYLFPGL